EIVSGAAQRKANGYRIVIPGVTLKRYSTDGSASSAEVTPDNASSHIGTLSSHALTLPERRERKRTNDRALPHQAAGAPLKCPNCRAGYECADCSRARRERIFGVA